MPVVSDPTKRLAEAQDTDHVQLMGFGISYIERIANFSLVPGSYDSQGKFHESHKAPVANLSINGNSPTERELFDDLFLDNKGNPKLKLDDAFVKRLLKDEGFLELARISHEWCPRLHLGEGKGVGSWLAGAKMPTELRKWAWMTGVAGNGEVKSDYRDSYPDQRREGWDV